MWVWTAHVELQLIANNPFLLYGTDFSHSCSTVGLLSAEEVAQCHVWK